MTTYEDSVGTTGQGKFIFGGLLILAAVVFLIFTATAAGQQYFFTIDELYARGDEAVGLATQISGAVIGDTIEYDPETLKLTFTVAHMPADNDLLNDEGGLAAALNTAVSDPTRQRLDVVYYGVKPDLLQHEAQAIMTGKLGADGIFVVEELLLKCPTRYDEALPEQAEVETDL